MAKPLIVQNCSLPGEIIRKSALEWSHENKIAICTKQGMYIMSSYCSPIETGFPLPLHKQVISPPAEMLDFKLFQNIPLDDLAESHPEPIYQIMMDHTLIPRTDMSDFRGFKCSRWSPKGGSTDGSCLLATLALDHRLVLYQEKDREWEQVCDLSEMLFDIRKSLWNDECDEDDSSSDKDYGESSAKADSDAVSLTSKLQKLKERAYNLAAMEIAWTNMFSSPATPLNGGGNIWCYLIVALKNGHVVWWKISPDDVKMVTFAHEWDPGLGFLTALNWQQTSATSGFLVLGSYMGQIALATVNVRIEDPEPKIVIKPINEIWTDEDRAVADNIVVLKNSAKKYIVVATKQNFLISCEVSLTDSDAIIKNVGHSVGLNSMPVTGMSVMNGILPQTYFLLSSMEGLIVKEKVNAGANGIEFKHEAIDLPDVDFENNTIQGLGVSPNGALCAIILNTTAYFDHLIKREPLQFVMFVTKSFDEIFLEFEHALMPQFSFLPSATNSICRYMDYLDCTRIRLASSADVAELFKKLIGWTVESYDRLSAIELQFIRFLLKCFISDLAVNVPFDRNVLKTKLDAIETVIMRNYVSKVVSSCHDKINMLSPAQGQSLLLMADWLYMQYGCPINNLYETFGYDCPSDIQSIPPRETCRICQLPVKLENIHFGECEQKHKFGRCCQSLILCDVTPYYQCLSCRSMALEDVWCNKFICTYCSLPMCR